MAVRDSPDRYPFFLRESKKVSQRNVTAAQIFHALTPVNNTPAGLKDPIIYERR
ncbi:MAG: hypothetical protein ACYSQZ_02295 [Planctomycetota bacterium]